MTIEIVELEKTSINRYFLLSFIWSFSSCFTFATRDLESQQADTEERDRESHGTILAVFILLMKVMMKNVHQLPFFYDKDETLRS